jgi:pyruvate formate lyase activating enzyme
VTGEQEGDCWTAEKGAVRCHLCPRHCLVRNGGTGFCKVRTNIGGRLILPFYGEISALAIDPIEKKPLYHFYPGSRIVSVGFYGCTLDCPFCQNWNISREFGAQTGQSLSPEALVGRAVASGVPLMAFTYSEPLVHFEYLMRVLHLAREAGLETVLVTNGMLNREPALRLIPLVDAFNIDLKSFSGDYYASVLKGDLESVLSFIRLAAESSHVELTTLLIPGDNESPGELESLVRFIASVSVDIPWHVSGYRPEYRYRKAPTPVETVSMAVSLGKSFLKSVYTGNMGDDNNTVCPGCSRLLVSRSGYFVKNHGWDAGRCRYCGSRQYGR